MSLDEVFDLSKVDPWFLAQIQDIVSSEMQVNGSNITDIDARELF
jgi:carbamoyl-phosphate synthase large subunit